ncbi:uncharacterized protein LOC121049727 isoform X2 [Rosa chinensis]|nr:uncharacterized protein LOC121049727 isoform X2 [Rosa chinensis]
MRVNVHQWKLLVRLWDLPYNQERSVKATRNRLEGQVSHTCGTKSFAQVRFEFEQVYDQELNRLSFFTLTHTRQDGEPIDTKFGQIIDDFKEKLKEYEDKKEEVIDIVRNKGYFEVLGPEKRNKVRGFGAGVNWSDVLGIVTQESLVTRDVKELKAAYEVQVDAVNLAQ